jgi:hypothetical protein
MARIFTKQEVNRMTSAEYMALYGNLKAGLTPEQEAFRNFVDGTAPTPEAEAPAPPQIGKRGPRDRQEVVETVGEPAAPGFDPSFDDVPATVPAPSVAAAVVESPVVPAAPVAVVSPAPVEVPAELPERIHRYQPVDENGKKIGGEQVFKYRTEAELIEQLTKSNIHVRVMAQKTREELLMNGTEVPAEATAAEPLVLRERLSAEDRAAWESKLEDPAEAAKARYVLDRDDDREVQNNLLRSNYENRVLLAIESFKNRNRDYAPTQDNAAKLIGYVERRGLDPTNPRNYQKAYDVLRENGVIQDASGNQVTETVLAPVPPTVREEKTVPAVAPAPATTRIGEPAVAAKQVVAQIPTGLSNADQLSEGDNAIPQAHWHTVRVYLKDGKGNPTRQYQEFHDLEAIERTDDKTLRRFIADQSPRGKAFRAAWDKAEAEKGKRWIR